MNLIALEGRSTAIYRAPNGWLSTVTGNCYVVARRRKAQKRAAYVGGFLSYLLVALRHQANLARQPGRFHSLVPKM
jgi:hypothetical protein